MEFIAIPGNLGRHPGDCPPGPPGYLLEHVGLETRSNLGSFKMGISPSRSYFLYVCYHICLSYNMFIIDVYHILSYIIVILYTVIIYTIVIYHILT